MASRNSGLSVYLYHPPIQEWPLQATFLMGAKPLGLASLDLGHDFVFLMFFFPNWGSPHGFIWGFYGILIRDNGRTIWRNTPILACYCKLPKNSPTSRRRCRKNREYQYRGLQNRNRVLGSIILHSASR